MALFDVADAIFAFAGDMSRTVLELPHMTTGQRKTTKKLLEQYPKLHCESYGFGAERRLHLFKKDMACERQTKTGTSDAALEGKQAANEQALALEVACNEVSVRNTFIHFEGRSLDNRVVQSMPHGMFKQSLLEESSSMSSGDYTPTTGCDTPSTISEPDLEQTFCPMDDLVIETDSPFSAGTLVVVHGLVKATAFNGRTAVVQSWDETTGRYDILVASSGGCQQAKIKEENLRAVLPCP